MRGLLLAAVALWAIPALAQADCDDERAARTAFSEARTLAEQRQLSAARDAYRRSLNACDRVPTAYNLAVVLLQLGDAVQAEAESEAILAGERGPLDDDARTAVESILERARQKVATVRVRARGAPAGSTLSIDGGDPMPLQPNGVLVVRTNPGNRRLVLQAPDGRVAQTVESMASAEEREVLLLLAPLTPATEERERPPPSRTGVWIGVVVGVLVVAAGVTAAVLLTRTTEPVDDPVWGRAELPLFSF